ncbi:MAG: hypothetical protein A3I04_07840 [Nitrospinae bacterium RIFCSPLOWO2_02_FULL_39_110]|nr:MAG: hypothetical protein A2W53_03125 [Nitrospinae bacterium RIFCSPHIGHO2_02_39_11]OGV99457.1 MAG: hypothetical protein A3D97_06855 [Nitrospinae bacterium RIFCSPHIGHO2_12_FULL_39_42]OGW01423.1 MAG: hypothetical protein A3D20_02645 [Nitrospinae bacterium RIFCSPHIGHO2_02_FULL_39_82]OGW03881.1 MAG: hypothetical protein A3I04_07840 [Nitrospinae bacterium RIFCSPLOWO2_02_FULL_39_110]OGW06964.1 MAG: hypothetical protein A2Z59_09255 [Nitrospinae bacterium RIFCSPLOWO2_02_39_17]OGW10705.1 MAG: hypoth
MSENEKKGKFKTFRDLYLISMVGVQLVVSILVGLTIGIYLDSKFTTSPIFTLIFLLFGIGAGFINFFRVFRGEQK